jgi:hypothetical protein
MNNKIVDLLYHDVRVAEVEGREIPMLEKGDKFRRKSDGKIFILKNVAKNQFILETEDVILRKSAAPG